MKDNRICEIYDLNPIFTYIYDEYNWEDWEYFLRCPELAKMKTIKPLRERFLMRVKVCMNEMRKTAGKEYDENFVGEKGQNAIYSIKIPKV